MAIAAFVIALVVLFGNAGAVYWLYRRSEAMSATSVGRDNTLREWIAGQLQAVQESLTYKPKPVDPKKPVQAPKSASGGWSEIKNKLERGEVTETVSN